MVQMLTGIIFLIRGLDLYGHNVMAGSPLLPPTPTYNFTRYFSQHFLWKLDESKMFKLYRNYSTVDKK